MTDIRNPRLIYLKGLGFLVILLASCALVVAETRSWKVAGLLALAVWSAARLYYFMFYVIERHVDPNYRFSGMCSFFRYLLRSTQAGRGGP